MRVRWTNFFLFAYRPETFKNYLLWIGQFSSFSTFSFGFPPWMFHNSTFKGKPQAFWNASAKRVMALCGLKAGSRSWTGCLLILDGKICSCVYGIHVASRRQPPAPHRSLLLPLFSSIAVAPRQEPLCGRHGLNDVVLTPSRPLVTANDVGHWDQKHPKVLIVGKKTRRIW